MSDPEVTWPPADELLQWRPDEYEIDADDDDDGDDGDGEGET